MFLDFLAKQEAKLSFPERNQPRRVVIIFRQGQFPLLHTNVLFNVLLRFIQFMLYLLIVNIPWFSNFPQYVYYIL